MIRLELFVSSLWRSVEFYTSLFQFRVIQTQGADYVALVRPGATLSLVPVEKHQRHSYFAPHLTTARLGVGVEIVLEVENVTDWWHRFQEAGHPTLTELREQPWGAIDFRVSDPDSYYWRITSRT